MCRTRPRRHHGVVAVVHQVWQLPHSVSPFEDCDVLAGLFDGPGWTAGKGLFVGADDRRLSFRRNYGHFRFTFLDVDSRGFDVGFRGHTEVCSVKYFAAKLFAEFPERCENMWRGR